MPDLIYSSEPIRIHHWMLPYFMELLIQHKTHDHQRQYHTLCFDYVERDEYTVRVLINDKWIDVNNREWVNKIWELKNKKEQQETD